MQNHLEISSKTHFWTRNVRNLSKSLTESLRKVYVIFQDLSRRTHKGPYGPIRAHMGPNPDRAPRNSRKTYIFIETNVFFQKIGSIRARMGPYGPIRAHMGPNPDWAPTQAFQENILTNLTNKKWKMLFSNRIHVFSTFKAVILQRPGSGWGPVRVGAHMGP